MRTDPPPPAFPRNFLRPCLLLLLREQSGYGYDLLERLRPLGHPADDPGRLYRTLRALEGEGLVRSGWAESNAGPARRVYEITRAGVEALHEEAGALDGTRDLLNRFLSRYAEFVALAPREAAVEPDLRK
jgi:poly-beta-hydroxybutyrate-responsive repressor